jgi:type II restriction/modification system DNA methylase subunit YeeA
LGWENTRPGRDLRAALKQLTDYSLELENPPLLVVSDREIIEIHTAFTGYPDQPRRIAIADIGIPENLQTLRWVFTEPEKLRPVKSLAAITEEAAGQFGALAETMRRRGLDSQPVAHFLIQCLFCMFAEDEGLLPRGIFTGLLAKAAADPIRASNRLAALFGAMQSGGDYGDDTIAWFNGGLFATIAVPPLEGADLVALQHAADMDWRNIDPSIFGTLFERGLNPSKRSQLGAHYTDPATIMRLIDPVIVRPLTAEWQGAKTAIAALLKKSKKQNDKAHKDAAALFHGHLERLRNYRVLDAACGSGNFLYLALKSLKDLERRANTEAEALGLQRQVSIEVSPANVLGIELDAYAAELARVTVWIGEIQWMLRNGYPVAAQPILRSLDTIENRDALLQKVGAGDTAIEADWPACDAIVGNPPFLGDKKMRGELGDDYVTVLRKCYEGRVPGGADLVTYWFEKARAQISAGKCKAAGLVATQAIRSGANRKVLDAIGATGRIFDAWGDEPWINEGAAVRVSLVCFGNAEGTRLNGEPVAGIGPDLSELNDGLSLAEIAVLRENALTAFIGTQQNGPFNIPAEEAAEWLRQPNPNGRSNGEVLKPWANGQDIVGRPSHTWTIDFGVQMSEDDAALYELPFARIARDVRPMRQAGNRESRKRYWWRLGEPMPALRAAIGQLERYIATPRVAKHRFFVWLPRTVLPDCRLTVIARSDDVSLGMLSSRPHLIWALANASIHGDGGEGGRPVYNAKSCFETFPFPEHMTPRDTAPVIDGRPILPSLHSMLLSR